MTFDATQPDWTGHGSVGGGATGRTSTQSFEDELAAETGLWWRGPEALRDELRAGVNTSYQLNTGAERLHGIYRGQLGRAEAVLSHSAAATAVDATLSTTVAASLDGVAVGGREANVSGAIVEIASAVPGARFDLLVNEGPWGTVVANTRTLVPLTPYESYTLRPIATGERQVDFDASARSIIVYPGNVYTLVWQSHSVVIVLGTLVTESGAALGRARIMGPREAATTDDEGFFQISAPEGDSLPVRLADGSTCTLSVPPALTDDGIIDAGNVVCVAP